MLQGCERVDQVWRRYLRTGLFHTDKIPGFAAFDGDFGPPFAIPPVEDQNRIGSLQPQDIEEVIGFRPIQGNPCAEG